MNLVECLIMPGILEKSGATPNERMCLFYTICIPLRLFLTMFVFWHSSSTIVQGVLLLTSLTSIFTNFRGMKTANENWWSQNFHLLTSILIFSSVIGRRSDVVPYVMFADVVFGLSTSIARDPWDILN